MATIGSFSDEAYNEQLSRLEDNYLKPPPPGEENRYSELREQYRIRKGYKRNTPGFRDSPEFRRSVKNFRDAARRLRNTFARERVNEFLSGNMSNITSVVPGPIGPFYLHIGEILTTWERTGASPNYQGQDRWVFITDDFDSGIRRGTRLYQDEFQISLADRDSFRAAAAQQNTLPRDMQSDLPEVSISILSDGMNVFTVAQFSQSGF